jgi:hypothetical protein
MPQSICSQYEESTKSTIYDRDSQTRWSRYFRVPRCPFPSAIRLGLRDVERFVLGRGGSKIPSRTQTELFMCLLTM